MLFPTQNKMPLIKLDHKNPSWIKYGLQRIKNKKNFLVGTYGKTGSGKSYADLSVAEMWNPDFADHPERICFAPSELMSLINSGTLKKGHVIIPEEMGVQTGNREWQSANNKAILQLIQTFRNLGLIVLINTPYQSFIDKGIRKLLHANWKTVGIDYENKTVKILSLIHI